jgi:hypothetical protein
MGLFASLGAGSKEARKKLMENQSIGLKPSKQAWENENLFCHDLPSKPQSGIGKVLVTGASGYIGGRLVPELLARGYRVRVMVRAAVIIGSGSASYEMIQNLVRKLPVLLIPRWAKTKCQPIAISLSILTKCRKVV